MKLKFVSEKESAFKVLSSSIYDSEDPLTPVQANDEIITMFCQIHGGLEEAMPIIRTQFKKCNVDFAKPTKEGLRRISERLVHVTSFLKGTDIAEMERKRFSHLIDNIVDDPFIEDTYANGS